MRVPQLVNRPESNLRLLQEGGEAIPLAVGDTGPSGGITLLAAGQGNEFATPSTVFIPVLSFGVAFTGWATSPWPFASVDSGRTLVVIAKSVGGGGAAPNSVDFQNALLASLLSAPIDLPAPDGNWHQFARTLTAPLNNGTAYQLVARNANGAGGDSTHILAAWIV
jgi:hypothetical protein